MSRDIRRPSFARPWLAAAIALTVLGGTCDSTTAPVWVDGVTFEPDSLFLIPGETGEFTSVPVDRFDNELPDRASRTKWSVSNATIASIEPLGGSARVTALRPGSTFVEASLGRGSGSGPIYVEPAELSRIDIDPPGNFVLERFRGVTVRAVLIDLNGDTVPTTGYRVSWGTSSVQTMFMVGTAEVVAAPSTSIFGRNQGTATLRLQVGDRKVTRAVVVR